MYTWLQQEHPECLSNDLVIQDIIPVTENTKFNTDAKSQSNDGLTEVQNLSEISDQSASAQESIVILLHIWMLKLPQNLWW